MPSLLRSMVILAGVALAGACGARSQLDLSSGQGGADTSAEVGAGPGSTGASTSSSGGSGGGGGGGPPACAAWSFVSSLPTKLPNNQGDTLLTSVVADGAEVLIATTNDNDPSPDPSWHIVSLTDDASLPGLTQTPMSRPATGVSFGGMSLAVGPAGRGGLAWDEVDGCRFVQLEQEGVPNGSPVKILGAAWCYWLSARPGGFSAFSSTPFGLGSLELYSLDPAGHTDTATPSLVLDDSAAPAGHVNLADASTLLAWSLPDGMHAAHVDPGGGAIGAPGQLLATAVDATRFSLRAFGGGALMAWSPPPAPSDVHVQRVAADLTLGSSSVIATAVPDLDGIDAAEVTGGALVAWLSSGMPTSVLTVQAIDETGAPVGPPLTNDVPSFANNLRIVRTPLGAMVVFEAEEQLDPVQVFALALQCAP